MATTQRKRTWTRAEIEEVCADSVAFHEAAHAVVHLLAGAESIVLRLLPDGHGGCWGDGHGETSFALAALAEWRRAPRRDRLPRWLAAPAVAVRIQLAGSAAEAIRLQAATRGDVPRIVLDALLDVNQADRDDAFATIDGVLGGRADQAERAGIVEREWKRTRRIVAMSWPAVERIARALVARTEVADDELRALAGDLPANARGLAIAIPRWIPRLEPAATSREPAHP